MLLDSPLVADSALVLLDPGVVVHVVPVGAAQVGELPLAVGALCDVAVAQAGLLGVQPRLVLVQVVRRAEPAAAELAVDLEPWDMLGFLCGEAGYANLFTMRRYI